MKELRAEQRALSAPRPAERRLEQEVRQRADEQLAAEREQQDGYQAALAAWRSGRSRAGSHLAGWPQDREPPRLPLLTRAEMHSSYDKEAERVVAAGGGIQAVIAVTNLRTPEHAVRHVDPVILRRAFDNDALERAQPRRTLACDYDVAHTTLGRYFARPEIKKQLRHTVQQLRAERRAHTARRPAVRQVKPALRPSRPPNGSRRAAPAPQDRPIESH